MKWIWYVKNCFRLWLWQALEEDWWPLLTHRHFKEDMEEMLHRSILSFSKLLRRKNPLSISLVSKPLFLFLRFYCSPRPKLRSLFSPSVFPPPPFLRLIMQHATFFFSWKEKLSLKGHLPPWIVKEAMERQFSLGCKWPQGMIKVISKQGVLNEPHQLSFSIFQYKDYG